MSVLARILSQYDLVALQEIRDAEGTAIEKLEAAVDGEGTDYEYLIGLRLGRTSSKEQYVFLYRVSTVTPGDSYTYADPGEICHHQNGASTLFTGPLWRKCLRRPLRICRFSVASCAIRSPASGDRSGIEPISFRRSIMPYGPVPPRPG